MNNDTKEIDARPLSDRQRAWIGEILETKNAWEGVDISDVRVVAEGPCDEGISVLLSGPERKNPKADPAGGYIGRIVIQTEDSFIEVRLTEFGQRLHEMFVLFVDPLHPQRRLPESWVELSHVASPL